MTTGRGYQGPASRRGSAAAFQPLVSIRADDGATAEIRRHGAHVTSWRPAPGGEERLFLSSTSEFGASAAIRGGVPIIFPQFGPNGPLQQHGFARRTTWGLGGIGRASNGMAEADFVLRDSPDTRAVWDHAFMAVTSVRIVGDQLAVTFTVENLGEAPFDFTAALHTYLRVHDVDDVSITGLQGSRYRVPGSDALIEDEEERVRVGDYLERIYVGAPSRIVLHEGSRSMLVMAEGFPDAVLWNPGPVRAASVPDIEPGGERSFVCIEAAVVQTPVTLGPRRRWMGTQTLTAR
ncbi:MAG: D-hexose-6-phosphate mutarotase [Gemmatimonadetes bacterium]|nr:D-hexose-6-phosphate mutarotase [Gemmatimonadota bacterium]